MRDTNLIPKNRILLMNLPYQKACKYQYSIPLGLANRPELPSPMGGQAVDGTRFLSPPQNTISQKLLNELAQKKRCNSRLCFEDNYFVTFVLLVQNCNRGLYVRVGLVLSEQHHKESPKNLSLENFGPSFLTSLVHPACVPLRSRIEIWFDILGLHRPKNNS